LEGGLVGLDRQEEIAALFEKDLLARFHLSMQGIGQHNLAAQLQTAEYLPGGWDLVALGLGDYPAQIVPSSISRINHFHTAVTHLLTIDHDQPIWEGTQQLSLPIQKHSLQRGSIDLAHDSMKGGLLGTAGPPGALIPPET
jgi:hypothetical protein